ncbi:hypothetical protein CPC08DRAFT_816502 [Agrocybe pediades]|nr:hypothetical protein CPC08DRAFT_816502 [Agrocybe pediades]
MQFKSVLCALSLVVAAIAQDKTTPTVLTAERVFQTIIDQSPFMVMTTTTTTWTQSPSITEAEPTTPPTPTIAY